MFPVVSQTIAAIPPLLSVTMAYRGPKTDLTRGVSQKKLASEAYRAGRGASHEIVSPIAQSWDTNQKFWKGVGGYKGLAPTPFRNP